MIFSENRYPLFGIMLSPDAPADPDASRMPRRGVDRCVGRHKAISIFRKSGRRFSAENATGKEPPFPKTQSCDGWHIAVVAVPIRSASHDGRVARNNDDGMEMFHAPR
jgi:hypothetical protein